MTFGKHKGRRLSWIMQHDPQYMDWLYEECEIKSPWLREAVDLLVRLQARSHAIDDGD